MIQPLRTVHRRAFITLALVLPTILVVGLRSRHPALGQKSFDPHLPGSAVRAQRPHVSWPKYPGIHTTVYSDAVHPTVGYVILRPQFEWNEPDTLLYWSADIPQGDSLPAQAKLLGPYAGTKAFALPPEAAGAGHLILYSLAHHAVVDTATLEKLP